MLKYIFKEIILKGTGSRDFWHIFLLRFYMGLIWSQSSKIPCPRNQQLQGHSIFSLGLSNNCYWVCLYRMFKHTQVPFLPECSFKICERPSKFAVGARTLCPCEANNFFGMCPRSLQRLHRQHRCSQRLRGHTFPANIFLKIKNLAKLFLPVLMGSRKSFL